jgi:CBS domain-containing protein
VPIGEKEVRVTVSLGVAQRYEDTQTCGQLVDQADQALLCAKQSGRDRVVCYESLGDTKVLKPRDGNNQNVLFRGVLARHVMTPLVACLRQDDTIGQAAEFFLRLRINSTPVVDATGRLAGMLSEKDLLAAMASLECWQRPVREVMKPNVICYEEDTPIRVIYEFLCRVSIRRVVIVSQGQPTGTISRGTLLRWFGNLVLSKGLLNEGEVLQEGELEARRARQRLVETARELARLASSLERRVEENAEDLVSYIVGEATGMQDLLTDILAHSRFVAPGGGVPAWTQSLVVDSGHID